MMKSVVASFLLVAVCFAIGVFADHDPNGMKEVIKECAAERNIEPDDLKAMMPPKNDEEKLTLDCVATCTLQKKEALVDDKLQPEKLKEMVDNMPHKNEERAEELKAKVDECVELAHAASGECAVGGTFVHCFLPAVHHGHHHHD